MSCVLAGDRVDDDEVEEKEPPPESPKPWDAADVFSYGIIPFRVRQDDDVDDNRSRKNIPHVEYLLIQPSTGFDWAFTNGDAKEGEAPRETALRKCGEEIGIGREKLSTYFDIEQTFAQHYEIPKSEWSDDNDTLKKTSRYYLAQVKPEHAYVELTLPREGGVREYKWLTFADARKMFLKRDRNLLERAHAAVLSLL